MLSGPGGRACPQVYIDGMPSTTDADQIPPTAIYGIEVYREGPGAAAVRRPLR